MEKEQEDVLIQDNGTDHENEAAADVKEEIMTDGTDDTAEETDDRDPITVAKENFYDRLPFTYRQVDIFCKVLIGVLIAIFVYYAVLK